MPEYLRRHRFLRTRDLDESRAVMSGVWGEHRVTPTSQTPFATAINHARVGTAGLTFVDCRAPLLIECASDSDCYTIGFQEAGASRSTANGVEALSTPASSVIWEPGHELRVDTSAARVLCLSLPRDGVEEGLRVRESPAGRRHPAPPVDVTTGVGATLRSLGLWAARELDKPDTPLASALVSSHMEQALLSLFLQCLWGPAARAADDRRGNPGKVRLAEVEDWIQANLREPISVETLARVAGVSTRAVQLMFRRHRDCTPLEFVRRARLREARRMILLGGPDASVTRIALELGFLHLGHFARAYRQLFGERPSDTRHRG
jgi:AraC-like DNA-binding protein